MRSESPSPHLLSLCVLLLLTGLAFGSSESSGPPSRRSGSAPTEEPDKIEAWVMAQQFVRNNMKSPGSADFGSAFGGYQDPDRVVTEASAGKFRVRAWVDAENSFGAKIRTHFICELEHTGNGQWRLIDLQFLN